MPSELNKAVIVNAAELCEVCETGIEDALQLLQSHVYLNGRWSDAYEMSVRGNQVKNCIALIKIVNPSFDEKPYLEAINICTTSITSER